MHRFHVDGRDYVVMVCGCADHADDDSLPGVERILFTCVPDKLLDHEDDAPEQVVGKVIEHVHAQLPAGIAAEDWSAFMNKVYGWVCAHRAAASLRDHEV
jgi:hypothetical protein